MSNSRQSKPPATEHATRVASWIVALSLMGSMTGGCLGAQIEANKQQLQQQQAELQQLKGQIASMQQSQTPYSTAPAPAGSCDAEVMRKATQRGGDAFAKSKFTQALGYYQDAATACPGNAESELNLGRTHEALGDRDAAISDYTSAANAGGSDPAIAQQAHDALERLRASK